MLLWLADCLQGAGLPFKEAPGWKTRGHGDVGSTLGVICHHTACGHGNENMPSEKVVEIGRPDLSGPLCHLLLGRGGDYEIIAAGLAWHAGPGAWKGVTAGNSHFVGIEAENAGDGSDPWPDVQMDAYARGCAAVMKHVGGSVDMVIGHKEWAPGRKIDPSFNMDDFRLKVKYWMLR